MLQTSLPTLDRALHGGLAVGLITEVRELRSRRPARLTAGQTGQKAGQKAG